MKTMMQKLVLFLATIVTFHARAGYDPSIQRWIQLDPIGERGGINLYGFVGNNPVNFYDPLGLAFGDWYDWSTYSPAYAQAQGVFAIQAQLARGDSQGNSWNSMNEFRLDHPGYNGDLTAGDTSAAQAGAGIASEAANVYLTAATSVVPTGAGARCASLLMPSGKALGQAGSKAAIRELQGGMNEAQTLFDQLSQGGKVVPSSTYQGTLVQLPNGAGTIGLRTVMTKSPGTAATIDVNVPGIGIDKIKFNP